MIFEIKHIVSGSWSSQIIDKIEGDIMKINETTGHSIIYGNGRVIAIIPPQYFICMKETKEKDVII